MTPGERALNKMKKKTDDFKSEMARLNFEGDDHAGDFFETPESNGKKKTKV